MSISSELFLMRDESYARFQQKLIPTVPLERVIGVRTPQLRAYAKRIAGSQEARAFLGSLPHPYYDENNLHGALPEHISDFNEALAAVESDRILPETKAYLKTLKRREGKREVTT